MTKPYQDVWRAGRLVTKGRRECARRFESIAEHVGPIDSLLDVGGWDGYFARRFSEAGAEAVLIEPRSVHDLPDRVAHRQERVDGDTPFPHVDVALALAVLHHMPDWEQVYANLRAHSRTLIVEAAHPDELLAETNPTLEATGARIAPVYERVLGEGTTIATTPAPNKVGAERPRRPIVAIANTITGTIDGGLGRASEVMTARPSGFFDPLGYEPVAGTLNLRVGRSGRSWVRRLPNPIVLDAEGGGTAGPYWPVAVNGVQCHVRCSKALTVVELVAPVRLRDFFGLGDGDEVEVWCR